MYLSFDCGIPSTGESRPRMTREARTMEQDNARVVSEAIAAWNARDAERYVALLDEDCLVETHGESPVVWPPPARRCRGISTSFRTCGSNSRISRSTRASWRSRPGELTGPHRRARAALPGDRAPCMAAPSSASNAEDS